MDRPRIVEDLNKAVTLAIFNAERAEEKDQPGLWLIVSIIEEAIAKEMGNNTPNPEGRIARRGALRAALKAGNIARALELFNRYYHESGTTEITRNNLKDIVAQHLPEDWDGSL